VSFVFNFFAATISVIYLGLSGKLFNLNLSVPGIAWIYLFIAVFMYAIFERYKFKASKLIDASVYSTVLNISVLIAFLGSIFLYSESLTLAKLTGGSLVLLALFLVSQGKKSKKHLSLRGIMYTVGIAVALGFGWLLDKKGAMYFSPITYNFFVWLLPLPIIFFPYIKIKDLVDEFKISSWKIIILSALNILGYMLQLKALEIQEATKVIPIIQTTALFTALFGILVLKERENIGRKIIAAIIALAGVFMLI
jgi:drug/metabolite transporter (DMT)-like permease